MPKALEVALISDDKDAVWEGVNVLDRAAVAEEVEQYVPADESVNVATELFD